jgi:hypothetical protein
MDPKIKAQHQALWGYIVERIELAAACQVPAERIGYLKEQYFESLFGEDPYDNPDYPTNGCYLCDYYMDCHVCPLAREMGACMDDGQYQDLLDALGAPEGEEDFDLALKIAKRILNVGGSHV